MDLESGGRPFCGCAPAGGFLSCQPTSVGGGSHAASGRRTPALLSFFRLATRHVLTTISAMNLRFQNQLNMVGACITVAQSSDYKPVWNGKPPTPPPAPHP